MVSLIYIEMCFFVFHIYATEYLYVSDLLNKKKTELKYRDFSAPKSVARATARAQWDSWEPSKRCKCGTWAAR